MTDFDLQHYQDWYDEWYYWDWYWNQWVESILDDSFENFTGIDQRRILVPNNEDVMA